RETGECVRDGDLPRPFQVTIPPECWVNRGRLAGRQTPRAPRGVALRAPPDRRFGSQVPGGPTAAADANEALVGAGAVVQTRVEEFATRARGWGYDTDVGWRGRRVAGNPERCGPRTGRCRLRRGTDHLERGDRPTPGGHRTMLQLSG